MAKFVQLAGTKTKVLFVNPDRVAAVVPGGKVSGKVWSKVMFTNDLTTTVWGDAALVAKALSVPT